MRRPRLLGLALRNLFAKPATVQFPREKTAIEEDSRGVQFADLKKCTGCSLCALECPADAIKMVPIPQGYEVPSINPRKVYPLIDYSKCVYCYRCVKICPFNAYITTSKFDIAGGTKPDSAEYSLSTLKKVS